MKKTIDYHDFTDINTPKEKRDELYVGDIYINAVVCLICDDEVRSRNKHDFRTCRCGNVSVDGGSFHARRHYKTGAYAERTIYYRDAQKSGPMVKEEIYRGETSTHS
jgi:hypothetical protein